MKEPYQTLEKRLSSEITRLTYKLEHDMFMSKERAAKMIAKIKKLSEMKANAIAVFKKLFTVNVES